MNEMIWWIMDEQIAKKNLAEVEYQISQYL